MSNNTNNQQTKSSGSLKVWDNSHGLGSFIWHQHRRSTSSGFRSAGYFPRISDHRRLVRSPLSMEVLRRRRNSYDSSLYRRIDLPLVNEYGPMSPKMSSNTAPLFVPASTNGRRLFRSIDSLRSIQYSNTGPGLNHLQRLLFQVVVKQILVLFQSRTHLNVL